MRAIIIYAVLDNNEVHERNISAVIFITSYVLFSGLK